MRNLQIITITLFLVLAIAFCALFFYNYLMLDRVAPQIVCDGVPLEVSVSASDKELCAGLTATDDVDGDLTDRIIVRRVSKLLGSNVASVYYAVFDSASNYATFTRNVYYTDYCMPHFSLSQPLIYNVNSTIVLNDRLTAEDVLDGDISSRIRISSSAITNTVPGEYPLGIQVTNSSGDTAIANLTVLIQNVTSRHPVILLSDYLVYLKLGSKTELEDFRTYIESASESAGGDPVSPKDISISGEVDTAKRGCYDVSFSYTNDSDLTYTVILTVIVE